MKQYEPGSLENKNVVMLARLKRGDLVGKGLDDERGCYLGKVTGLTEEGVELENNSKEKRIISYSEMIKCVMCQNVDLV